MKKFVKAKATHKNIIIEGCFYEIKAEYDEVTSKSGRMIVIESNSDQVIGLDSSFFE